MDWKITLWLQLLTVTWGHFWAWHILFQHVYHNLWKSYIWKSIHLQKIRLFRSCGLKPCAVFIVRGAEVRSGCLCLVGVWTIHLKQSEIYVCQKMGHFSPIFLGANTSLTKIFEANTIYSQCFGTSTPLQIHFLLKTALCPSTSSTRQVAFLIGLASNYLWKQEASGENPLSGGETDPDMTFHYTIGL